MRIAILTTQCPFVVGGAELHARSLERALREFGHEAEIITMPFKWYPSTTILDHMLAARAMDVSEFNGVPIDLAICLKFPAYFMRHPNKTHWILHQHRQAYDLWDSGLTDLFDDPDGALVRAAIHEADNVEFRADASHPTRRIFANSANVAKRLLRYNDVRAEPLYHPPPLAGRLHGGGFGDYFYYPSRIAGAKRQDFVLKSLAKTKSRARVVFSGAPDNPAYGEELRKLAEDLGVADRVTWKGFVSDAEMIELYAGARGVLFTPVDEDLGYIALEAMLAGKPLLTLTDAGEPAALIRDGLEGCITAPEPAAFADALDRLTGSVELARGLGEAGAERYRSLDISWAHAVEKLTGRAVTPAPLAEAPVHVSSAPPPAAAMTSLSTAQDEALPAEQNAARTVAPTVEDFDPTPDLAALATRYQFGAHVVDHRAYYDVHWRRYRATLAALRETGLRPRRILEVGTSPPYVFTTLLRELFPTAQITAVQETPAGLKWRHAIKSAAPDIPDIDIDVHGLNVETTPLPFPDEHFDLVVAMEILEHFCIDPSFFFHEARRVLNDNGALLVTTPNLVSMQSLARALRGASPYSFGVFVPWHGAYGRHNREYTPLEVESLGRYAGLETSLLQTPDVYPGDTTPTGLVDYLEQQGCPTNLRGQNILYIGRKGAGAAPAPFPPNLFPIDPGGFSGSLELTRSQQDGDLLTLRVSNASRLTWRRAGDARIRLIIDRVDQNGLLTPDPLQWPLPRDLRAGESCDIFLRARTGAGLTSAWYEIGLYAEGAGPFKGAGRTRPVTIFAEHIEIARSAEHASDAT